MAKSKAPAKAKAKAEASRKRVRAYRARLRKQGLRPVQMWLPDTRTAAFKKEAHRQSVLVSQSPSEADDQAFIDSLFEWGDE